MSHPAINSVLVLNDSLHVVLSTPLRVPPAQVTVLPPGHDHWPIVLGGLLAIVGGLVAQWFRGFLEDERARKKLIRRIRSAFEICVASTTSMLKIHHSKPISAVGLRRIRNGWRRYDRLSDDLVLLPDQPFVEDIDSSCDLMSLVVDRLLGEEEQFRRTRRELGKVTPKGIETSEETEEDIREHRKKLLLMLRSLSEDSKRMLAEVNREWPPPLGHGEKAARVAPPAAPSPPTPRPGTAPE